MHQKYTPFLISPVLYVFRLRNLYSSCSVLARAWLIYFDALYIDFFVIDKYFFLSARSLLSMLLPWLHSLQPILGCLVNDWFCIGNWLMKTILALQFSIGAFGTCIYCSTGYSSSQFWPLIKPHKLFYPFCCVSFPCWLPKKKIQAILSRAVFNFI